MRTEERCDSCGHLRRYHHGSWESTPVFSCQFIRRGRITVEAHAEVARHINEEHPKPTEAQP